MEPRRRDVGPKRHIRKGSAVQVADGREAIKERVKSMGLEELPVVREEVLTDSDLAAIISRVQGFLEEKGPSPEEELEQLLSDGQVRLVRAAWGTLAPFLTRIRGFYQAVEGDCTFLYYLGPEYEWLAPSSPPATDQQELPPSETLVPSGEDTAPPAEQDGPDKDDIAAMEMGGMSSIWSVCASPCSTDSLGSGSYVTALDEMEEWEEEEEVGEKVEEDKKEMEEVEEKRRHIWTQTAHPYWELRDICETEAQTDIDFELGLLLLQVLRLSAEIESQYSQSDASGMHREWDEGFRRYQARSMDNAVGGDPLDLQDHSGPVADRQEEGQRSGSEEKENAPGVLLQPPGRGAVAGTSRKREGAEGGRVQRYWHGRPFRNRQNVPAASAAKGSHESVAKQPAVKPAAPKPSGPVTPPAKPRRPLPGEWPSGTESLEFHWHIGDTGATSVRVETKAAKSSTCTPKSKAEAQIERVVMSVKKRVPERSESEIRRCVDELRLTRGGYSRMTLGEIVDEVLEHIKGAF
ncbi:uncharacterized protein LOC144137387 isoform X2 [Haemaphysalis longicornis]